MPAKKPKAVADEDEMVVRPSESPPQLVEGEVAADAPPAGPDPGPEPPSVSPATPPTGGPPADANQQLLAALVASQQQTQQLLMSLAQGFAASVQRSEALAQQVAQLNDMILEARANAQAQPNDPATAPADGDGDALPVKGKLGGILSLAKELGLGGGSPATAANPWQTISDAVTGMAQIQSAFDQLLTPMRNQQLHAVEITARTLRAALQGGGDADKVLESVIANARSEQVKPDGGNNGHAQTA